MKYTKYKELNFLTVDWLVRHHHALYLYLTAIQSNVPEFFFV